MKNMLLCCAETPTNATALAEQAYKTLAGKTASKARQRTAAEQKRMHRRHGVDTRLTSYD